MQFSLEENQFSWHFIASVQRKRNKIRKHTELKLNWTLIQLNYVLSSGRYLKDAIAIKQIKIFPIKEVFRICVNATKSVFTFDTISNHFLKLVRPPFRFIGQTSLDRQKILQSVIDQHNQSEGEKGSKWCIFFRPSNWDPWNFCSCYFRNLLCFF